jgi:hypothetical protein
MFRIAIVSGIALFSVVAANAGQIQIGSGVNGADGLTSAYIGGGCTAGGPCTEQGYVPVMFAGAPVAPATGPGTFFDAHGDGGSGVTFAEINDGAGKNFWDLPTGSSTSVLTIPVGVYGVTDVWTMINDIEAVNNRDVTVSFNFGTSATVSSFTDSVLVTNAVTNGSGSHTGQVRNALVCTSGCDETGQLGLAANTAFVAPSPMAGSVTAVSENVWNQSFNPCSDFSPTVGAISCATGHAYLDDQGFFFNGLSFGSNLTNLNTYLVSVQVKEITGAGGGVGVSAVTVDAVPEPSTVLLFVAGLGVVGFGRLRKRA